MFSKGRAQKSQNLMIEKLNLCLFFWGGDFRGPARGWGFRIFSYFWDSGVFGLCSRPLTNLNLIFQNFVTADFKHKSCESAVLLEAPNPEKIKVGEK